MNFKLTDELPEKNIEGVDIFNRIEFFNLHKKQNSVYLSVFRDNQLIGVCHFTEIDPGVYRSPHRGTYGGFNFIKDIDLSSIYESVKLLIDYFKEKNIKELIFVQSPFSHNIELCTSVFNALLTNKFYISNQEFNQSLVVDNTPMIDKMMRNNKKRFKKCEREDFKFTQVFTETEFEAVHKMNEASRKRKGIKISMTFEQIMTMYRLFPNDMYFFNVTQNGVAAASSICIRINSNVLHIFYWGDADGFESYSPIAFLANGIYEFAAKNNFKMMDAGISTFEGIPNFGLITFKENLGFTSSLKLTYSYNYEQ